MRAERGSILCYFEPPRSCKMDPLSARIAFLFSSFTCPTANCISVPDTQQEVCIKASHHDFCSRGCFFLIQVHKDNKMNASSCRTGLVPYKLVDGNETFSNVILFLCIVNSVAAIVSTVGNFIVLVVIWRVSTLHSPAFVLLSGLALSDFSVGLVSQPVFIASNVALFYDNCAVLSILIKVHEFFACQLLAVSFFTLSAIALDRFLALKIHLRYQEFVTVRRTLFCLVAIWIIAGIFATWMLTHRSSAEITKIVLVVGFLLATVIFYWKIFQIARNHQSKIANHIQTPHLSSQQQNIPNIDRYKKSVLFLVYIFILFCISYVPWVFWLVARHAMKKGDTVEIILAAKIFFTVSYLNSCFNPVLYCWRMGEIRQAMKEQIKVVLC